MINKSYSESSKKVENYLLKIVVRRLPLLLSYLIMTYGLVEIIIRGTNIIGQAIDTVLGNQEIEVYPMLKTLIILIPAGIIAAILKRLSSDWLSICIQREYKDITVTKVVDLQYGYFDDKGTGKIITTLISDINEVGRFFSEVLTQGLQMLITIVTCAIYICSINKILLIGILLCYPPILYLINIIAKRLVELAKKRRRKVDKVAEVAEDCIGGIVVARSYQLLEVLKQRMYKVIDDILLNEYERTKYSSISWVIKNLLAWIPNILCAMIVLWTLKEGLVSIGYMTSFMIILQRIVNPMSELPFVVNDAREIKVSMDRLNEILNQPMEKSGSKYKDISEVCGKIIELEDLTFLYEGKNKILNKINLSIEKGKTTAIVGDSGGGKTTLFKILIGFYRQQGGKYRLYGEEFEEWDLQQARKQMSVVTQNVFLFPGTIYENIKYGKLKAERQEVVAACKMANIHQFISQLPDGYETVVGERGIKLSGGEKQRISIARAILKNAPILLLDEPTSAVDIDTEGLIQEAIERISASRTIIIIAHRLSTIRNADKILVLENGQVVEEGTHTQLLSKNGTYASLYLSGRTKNEEVKDA